MKSGTHLIQELMVELGYAIYGQSRIPQEIRPVLDAPTRERIVRMVFGDAGSPSAQELAEEAWAALGWAWQARLRLPLINRYGMDTVNTGLVERVLRRTSSTAFAETPTNTCWVLPELDVKKVDGRFIQEWVGTGSPKIILNHRDPRDVLLSMVNFLDGRTAQGIGSFSDFLVFREILASHDTLESKLEYALTDPAFPGTGDFERALWLLNHPQVCAISFEELVGPRGGGSEDARGAAVKRITDFLGIERLPLGVGAGMYRPDAFSFFRGQIGVWREAFSPRVSRLADKRLGEVAGLYGYA